MEERHFIQAVYTVLALLKVDPSRMQPNLEHPDGGRVLLALPDSKVALTTEGDVTDAFAEDGWHLVPVSTRDLQAAGQVIHQLTRLVWEDTRRITEETVKQTSSQEDVLYSAIIRRGLPIPTRNLSLKRENGRELTVPDFAWEDLKVAFFLDGLWWHVTRDDRDLVESLKDPSAEQDLIHRNRTRAERDSEIRSTMTSMGWAVLTCTDRQVDQGAEEVERQIDRVSELLITRRQEYLIVQGASSSVPGEVSIDDLL